MPSWEPKSALKCPLGWQNTPKCPLGWLKHDKLPSWVTKTGAKVPSLEPKGVLMSPLQLRERAVCALFLLFAPAFQKVCACQWSKSTTTYKCDKLLVNTHINPWTEQEGVASHSLFPLDAKCSEFIIPEASWVGEPVIKADVSADLSEAVEGHRSPKHGLSWLGIPHDTCCFTS